MNPLEDILRFWLGFWPPALWRYDKERQHRREFPK